ncbi:cysteine synthase [Leisingera sp. ANG-M1]|uniref:PLP-dependent cysteine synthase family protein n=1 Tax=Leisingera sp. ANG-M1 TaxID=1577895 RepID=UPI00057D6D29|nr:cysteine synthase family protein [Leisingera sp. ANG-M1]KIC08900.1 cysteine synthase [Leisingera sp. ANG-M1]
MTTPMPSVLHAMERTPLIALDRLRDHLGLHGRLLAKLDLLMPGFSKKDRAARRTIEDARACGDLVKGQTVVELTSGNMGTGLAIVCSIYGHPFVAVMSEGNSEERARMMEALGAEVVRVPQANGSKPGEVSGEDLALVEKAAQQVTLERMAFRADQFCRDSNWKAHFDTTGPEIWDQSCHMVTGFCDFVGSGGTLGGVARYLATKGVPSYAVEPVGAEVLANGDTSCPAHPIQGGGYMMPDLVHLEGAPLVGSLSVTGEEARQGARMLARYEGIFGGFSAGANLRAAIQLLQGDLEGGCVAFVVCDSGLKYLSTDLWENTSEP